MAKKQIYAARQGEILILKINPKKHHWLANDRRLQKVDNVIREGEKSGHKHTVEGQGSLLSPEGQKDKGLVLDVGKEGAEIRHPEHETIKLSEGKYHVLNQREFSEKEDRKANEIKRIIEWYQRILDTG